MAKVENGMQSSTLLELGLSRYVMNIKKIIISEDWKGKKREGLPDLDEKLKKRLYKYKNGFLVYEQSGEDMCVNQTEE